MSTMLFRYALSPLQSLRYKVVNVCHEDNNGYEVKYIDAKNDKRQADVKVMLLDSW